MTLSAIVISSLIGGTTVKADAISDLKDEQNKLHQESSVLEEELKNKENQLSELQLKRVIYKSKLVIFQQISMH